MSQEPLQGFDFVPPLLANRLRNTHLKPFNLTFNGMPINGFPLLSEAWKCTSHKDRHLLFSQKKVLQILSRLSTRQNSAPFRAGEDPRILSITERHSLGKASCTRSAIGLPHGWACPRGGRRYELTTFRTKYY
jgi:hypothetical protein